MKSKKKLIVYIGSFVFPMGDAVAKRALGLGLSFADAGYSVAFIGESKMSQLHSIAVNGTVYEMPSMNQFSSQLQDLARAMSSVGMSAFAIANETSSLSNAGCPPLPKKPTWRKSYVAVTV